MERLVLSQKEFLLFKEYIYEHLGINLGDQKIYLVQARLAKRVKHLGLESFKAYYEYLINDKTGEEFSSLSSLISTNVTSFFREQKQWEFWKNNLHVILAKKDKKLRIWSAACSSGEEPYSIAMFLDAMLPERASWDIKILATDVSPRVLKLAQMGAYTPKTCESMDVSYRKRYFHFDTTTQMYLIEERLKKMVTFREFNLVTGNYKLFKASMFDIIFCRNVMIYFDKPTQQVLIEKFHTLLDKEGYFFIGSSEALTDQKQGFKSKSASIYQKV